MTRMKRLQQALYGYVTITRVNARNIVTAEYVLEDVVCLLQRIIDRSTILCNTVRWIT